MGKGSWNEREAETWFFAVFLSPFDVESIKQQLSRLFAESGFPQSIHSFIQNILMTLESLLLFFFHKSKQIRARDVVPIKWAKEIEQERGKSLNFLGNTNSSSSIFLKFPFFVRCKFNFHLFIEMVHCWAHNVLLSRY